jgi:hypothetical protein
LQIERPDFFAAAEQPKRRTVETRHRSGLVVAKKKTALLPEPNGRGRSYLFLTSMLAKKTHADTKFVMPRRVLEAVLRLSQRDYRQKLGLLQGEFRLILA